MPHKKPTPSDKRPTLMEMKFREAAQRQHAQTTAVVEGWWEQQPDGQQSPFKVKIAGDIDDVKETVESLKLNGNLHHLHTNYKKKN